jgi:hypothetical protein
MKTATVYFADVVSDIETTEHHMKPVAKSLLCSARPARPTEITRYINRQLTPKEEFICDMATD